MDLVCSMSRSDHNGWSTIIGKGWFAEPVDRFLHFYRNVYMHSHLGQWLIRSREWWNLICRWQGKINFAIWLMQDSKMASHMVTLAGSLRTPAERQLAHGAGLFWAKVPWSCQSMC